MAMGKQSTLAKKKKKKSEKKNSLNFPYNL